MLANVGPCRFVDDCKNEHIGEAGSLRHFIVTMTEPVCTSYCTRRETATEEQSANLITQKELQRGMGWYKQDQH